jgi:hypothetical protein
MKRLASRMAWWHRLPHKSTRGQRRRKGEAAMDRVRIDVHKRKNQISILTEGVRSSSGRIRIEPDRFAAVLGTRPRTRIVIEASTDRE